jgi:hypothetical protein
MLHWLCDGLHRADPPLVRRTHRPSVSSRAPKPLIRPSVSARALRKRRRRRKAAGGDGTGCGGELCARTAARGGAAEPGRAPARGRGAAGRVRCGPGTTPPAVGEFASRARASRSLARPSACGCSCILVPPRQLCQLKLLGMLPALPQTRTRASRFIASVCDARMWTQVARVFPQDELSNGAYADDEPFVLSMHTFLESALARMLCVRLPMPPLLVSSQLDCHPCTLSLHTLHPSDFPRHTLYPIPPIQWSRSSSLSTHPRPVRRPSHAAVPRLDSAASSPTSAGARCIRRAAAAARAAGCVLR